jgi:hypothetical protein
MPLTILTGTSRGRDFARVFKELDKRVAEGAAVDTSLATAKEASIEIPMVYAVIHKSCRRGEA